MRYLEHEGHANRGMSAARNLGLRNAVGEFVALIDSDDVWRPNKLAEQLRIMEEHPGLGMVSGTVRYWESWARRRGPHRTVWPHPGSLNPST